MTDGQAILRPLTLAELETLIDWAGDEGWNPGLADAEAFQAADPEGFIGCFVEDQLAAAIAATAYGDDFGFIGLYISHPDFRGKGYGKKVWDAGMRHLEGRSIGLDGVPAQQENYRRSGFAEQYRTWRWSGHFPPADTAAFTDIVTVTSDHLPEMLSFDQRFFSAPREAFMEQWCRAPRLTLALMRDGVIAGYGTLRQCRQGCKIGPLFAETPEDAQLLFGALANRCGAQVLHIDVPESNAAFSAFLEGAGFEKGFVTARMIRGPVPPAPAIIPAGITTLELG